jgi:hypothetical protein
MRTDEQEAVELRRRMAECRQLITDDLDTFNKTVRSLGDWKQQLARHSWAAFGVAALGGYWLVPRRRTVIVAPPTLQPAIGSTKSIRSMLFRTLASFAARTAIAYVQRRWSETRMQNGEAMEHSATRGRFP